MIWANQIKSMKMDKKNVHRISREIQIKCTFKLPTRKENSRCCTVAMGWIIAVWFQQRHRLSPSTPHPESLWGPPGSLPNEYQGLFRRVKRQKIKYEYNVPSAAEVKNTSSRAYNKGEVSVLAVFVDAEIKGLNSSRGLNAPTVCKASDSRSAAARFGFWTILTCLRGFTQRLHVNSVTVTQTGSWLHSPYPKIRCYSVWVNENVDQ